MIRYTTLGTNDVLKSKAFYDSVLGTLGLCPTDIPGVETLYSCKAGTSAEELVFAITKPFNGEPASAGNGTMMAFNAESKEQVRAAHAAALKAKGVCEGEPGPREHYHERMYAAYFRDLDGNKIAVVHFLPVTASL